MMRRILRARLPLVIFILILLSFLIAGSIIIHITLTSNLVNGGWLHIKTNFYELNFPKDWRVDRGEIRGENKSISIFNLVSADLRTILHLRFYDENATRDFMQENNLTNASQVLALESQQLYNWSLTQNENATFSIEEEGLMDLQGYKAHYMLIKINNGYKEDNTFYNITCLIISSFINSENGEKLFEIIFYGERSSWEKNHQYFEEIMDSMRIFDSKE